MLLLLLGKLLEERRHTQTYRFCSLPSLKALQAVTLRTTLESCVPFIRSEHYYYYVIAHMLLEGRGGGNAAVMID